MTTLRGDKILEELHRKHLAHVGNSIYNISPPLSLNGPNTRRDDLLAKIREVMITEQDCAACKGQCDPASHKFTEVQYTPSADAAPSLAQAMHDLLGDYGVTPNITVNGQNFISSVTYM